MFVVRALCWSDFRSNRPFYVDCLRECKLVTRGATSWLRNRVYIKKYVNLVILFKFSYSGCSPHNSTFEVPRKSVAWSVMELKLMEYHNSSVDIEIHPNNPSVLLFRGVFKITKREFTAWSLFSTRSWNMFWAYYTSHGFSQHHFCWVAMLDQTSYSDSHWLLHRS